MYLPGLFNKREEFQRLGGLLDRRAAPGTPPASPGVHELLFRATSVRLADDRMLALKQSAEQKLRRHRDQMTLDGEPVEFWAREVVDIIGQMAFAVGQLRIMQDLLLAILARLEGLRGVPQSLAAVMKRGPEAYGFRAALGEALRRYWGAGGQAVRNYRNLDHHFYAIARHSVMDLSPTENLRVRLPDDPGETSRREATFTGRVEGFEFLARAYQELERLTDETLRVMGVPSAPVPLVLHINEGVKAEVTSKRTVAVGLMGSGAFQMTYDPEGPSLLSENIALPANDPKDSPVPLPEVVKTVREKIKGAENVTAADLKYLGSPEFMLRVGGVEYGGPWVGWLWRFDRDGLSYFVLVLEDEKCPWVAWGRIAPGEDEKALGRLVHRAFVKRDRYDTDSSAKPPTVSGAD